MVNEKWCLGLDVGLKRIGVAIGDNLTKIAVPLTTIVNDEQSIDNIAKLCQEHRIVKIIVGLPRDNRGTETAQSQFARDFAQKLEVLEIPIFFQDESLTSVLAEERLGELSRDKEKIDAEAAVIILMDFLESQSV